MEYLQLAYLHLATVTCAFLIGGGLLVSMKGTAIHKGFGRVFSILMMFTAAVSLFMPAHLGPTFLTHFGFIHLFSFFVLFSIPRAIVSIRRGDVEKHKKAMVGVYVGGIIIAGSFAFMPGRLLNTWLFGG